MPLNLVKSIQVSCSSCSLETICLPRGLAAPEVEKVSSLIKQKKTLHRGEAIYREGDRFTGIIAIKSGTAKLIKDDHQSNEHILNVLLPGELLGFDGLYDDRHSCSAIALETVSICHLPSEQLESLCLKVPGLMREFFRHSSEKLNGEREQNMINKRPADERLASLLISLSSRFHKRGFSATEFRLPMTRQEIGNHLGLALETVSRLLKKFQDLGLITVNKRNIQIKDLEGLKNIYTSSWITTPSVNAQS